MSTTRPVSHSRVYTGHGDVHELELAACEHVAHRSPARAPTIADRVPIVDVMSRELICARPELAIDRVIRLMTDHHIGCMPVVDERGRPHGIVTKFDLVDELDRSTRGELPTARTAADVMMPLAITLDENATIAHAASMMALEDLHHVMIVACNGTLIGIVSSQDIVRWLVDNDELAGRAVTPMAAEPAARARRPAVTVRDLRVR